MSEPRALLGATVGPLASAVIARDFGPELRRRLLKLRLLGQVEAARQLSAALGQLEAAAAQVQTAPGRACVDEGLVGQARTEPDTTGWWSSSAVSRELGVTERRARDLASAGCLSGVKVRGRWLYDPLSVAEERERRRVAAEDRS